MVSPLLVPSRPSEGKRLAWHYSSVDALVNMVQSREIWASSKGALNDPTELDFASKLLNETVDKAEIVGWRIGDEVRELSALEARHVEAVVEAVQAEQLASETFVVSASRSSDKLSQWVHYAGADGVAIAFDSAEVLVHPPTPRAQRSFSWPEQGWGWLDMVYDRGEQVASLVATLDRIVAHVAEMGKPGGPVWEAGAAVDGWTLQLAMAKLKHPAYSEEEEVRHFAPRVAKVAAHYRARGSDVVAFAPLISQRPNTRETGRRSQLPIQAVMCGPAVRKGTVREIRGFLRASGLTDVEVEESSIPYLPRVAT